MKEKSITTLSQWLTQAQQKLASADIPTARLDAELLLSHTLRKPRTWLHGHNDDELSDRQCEIANARLDLRLDRVPVAYIVGHKEFYGRPFKVTTATLIPRPESETLIELIEEALPSNASLLPTEPLTLVDVGTGSGILGITAKLEHPELAVTLLDISRYALTVAEENARALEATVEITQSNLLQNYPFTANVIVANLPYVDPEWQRSPETDHEPAEALFANNHGLALIFELIEQTTTKLTLNGYLILEADPEQHTAIIKHASKFGLVMQKQEEYGLLLNKIA